MKMIMDALDRHVNRRVRLWPAPTMRQMPWLSFQRTNRLRLVALRDDHRHV